MDRRSLTRSSRSRDRRVQIADDRQTRPARAIETRYLAGAEPFVYGNDWAIRLLDLLLAKCKRRHELDVESRFDAQMNLASTFSRSIAGRDSTTPSVSLKGSSLCCRFASRKLIGAFVISVRWAKFTNPRRETAGVAGICSNPDIQSFDFDPRLTRIISFAVAIQSCCDEQSRSRRWQLPDWRPTSKSCGPALQRLACIFLRVFSRLSSRSSSARLRRRFLIFVRPSPTCD